ncbi:MAG: sigma-70 family RNA polymerase sigma factor [Eubacterium sp.]
MIEKDEMINLVDKAKKGDVDAFARLYGDTIDRAYYTAFKILKNSDDAQDIVQDSFIKAFTSLDSLDDPSRFESWMCCIVANKCKDYLKKKKPDFFPTTNNDDNDTDFIDTIVGTDTSVLPHEVTDNKETRRLVMECIDRLPDEQRLCVVMFYYDELSVKEIAQALGVSENTVKSRLNYARKKLRKDFEELEDEGIKLYALPFFPLIKFAFSQDSQRTHRPFIPFKKAVRNTLGKTADKLFLKGKVASAIKLAVKVSGVRQVLTTVAIAVAAVGVIGSSVTVARLFENRKQEQVSLPETQISQDLQLDDTLNTVEPTQYIDTGSFAAVDSSNLHIAYARDDGLYYSDIDFSNEKKIFDKKAKSIVFDDDRLYFICDKNIYYYDNENDNCSIVTETDIESFYSHNKNIYGINNNAVYSLDLNNSKIQMLKSFDSDDWYIDNGYTIFREGNCRKAFQLENFNQSYDIGKINSSSVDFKTHIDKNIAFVPNDNVDENGIITAFDLTTSTFDEISIGQGIIDFAVLDGSLFYTVYDNGTYKKEIDSGAVKKISDKELYFVSKGDEYIACCDASSNSTILFCGDKYIKADGIVTDFSLVGSNVFYEQNNHIIIDSLREVD